MNNINNSNNSSDSNNENIYKNIYVYDCEVFPNVTFFVFKQYQNPGFHLLVVRQDGATATQRQWLAEKLRTKALVGYNILNYDNPILRLVIAGANAEQIYDFSYELIVAKERPSWDIERSLMSTLPYREQVPSGGCFIDLINYAPLRPSLKVLMARLNLRSVIDGTFDFTRDIYEEQMRAEAIPYCKNDVLGAEAVLAEYWEEVLMRKSLSKEFGVNLLSSAPPAVARQIISNLYCQQTGINQGLLRESATWNKDCAFKYKPPVKLMSIPMGPKTKELLDIFTKAPIVVSDGRLMQSPKDIKMRIANVSITFGTGGCHSIDAAGMFESVGGLQIKDKDATSLYPNIIRLFEIVPRHFQPKAYLQIYNALIQKRLDHKKAGNKLMSDAFKLVLNSTFGDSGNKWSIMFDPWACVHVTLTGQLLLTSLLEYIGDECDILSCNTDGITLCGDTAQLKRVDDLIVEWEGITGLQMEETLYRLYCRRDVNNYIAICNDDSVKSKGAYAVAPRGIDLRSNQTEIAVRKAVIEYIRAGTPLRKTIRSCSKFTDFLLFKKASTGAMINGVDVGRVVRCYRVTKSPDVITSQPTAKRGETVMFKGCKGAMVLPDTLPDDIDYDAYESIAQEIVDTITVKTSSENHSFAMELLENGVPVIPVSSNLMRTGKRKTKRSSEFNDFLSALVCVQLGGKGLCYVSGKERPSLFEDDNTDELLWQIDEELFLYRASSEASFKLAKKNLAKSGGFFSGKFDLVAKQLVGVDVQSSSPS